MRTRVSCSGVERVRRGLGERIVGWCEHTVPAGRLFEAAVATGSSVIPYALPLPAIEARIMVDAKEAVGTV